MDRFLALTQHNLKLPYLLICLSIFCLPLWNVSFMTPGTLFYSQLHPHLDNREGTVVDVKETGATWVNT